jgi:hypothetical protein
MATRARILILAPAPPASPPLRASRSGSPGRRSRCSTAGASISTSRASRWSRRAARSRLRALHHRRVCRTRRPPVEEQAAEIDPVAKARDDRRGQRLPYDYLVVATGPAARLRAIEGMDVARIGQDGLGSVYAGPEQAEATWRAMSASPSAAARRCSCAPRPR